MARKQELEDPIKIEVKIPKQLVNRMDVILMFYNKNRSALIREFCEERTSLMEIMILYYFTNLAGYYLHKEILDIDVSPFYRTGIEKFDGITLRKWPEKARATPELWSANRVQI